MQELKIAIEVFHMVFGPYIKTTFLNSKVFIFHSTLATMTMIPFKRVPQYSQIFKLQARQTKRLE